MKGSKINTYDGKRALLLGNGINLLDDTQSVSWGDLLQTLMDRKDIDGIDLNNPFKPFPLAFEELLHADKSGTDMYSKARRWKNAIRSILVNQLDGRAGFNEYHTKFANSRVNEILTTNYDYGLEKSVIENFDSKKPKLAQNKRERKNSLSRRYLLPAQNKQVWHIHGELEDTRNVKEGSSSYNEQSIMIGYVHYSLYLERIQETFRGKDKYGKENLNIWNRIKMGDVGKQWYEHFLTHELFIVGFGLDFSENHLWWLINERANYLKLDPAKQVVNVNNRVVFLYPKMPIVNKTPKSSSDDDVMDWYWKRNSRLKTEAVAGLLPSLGVEVEPVHCTSYLEFYDIVLERYLNR